MKKKGLTHKDPGDRKEGGGDPTPFDDSKTVGNAPSGEEKAISSKKQKKESK